MIHPWERTLANFEITAEQKEQLLEKGYVLLPGAIPSPLLKLWQDIAARRESMALEAHGRGEQLHGACVVEDPVGPRLMRYDDLFATDAEALLDLLSCPALMAVARELCGRGAVPLQTDILYKHQHPHPVIMWHQGAQHNRSHPYLNVGIYLDDAPEGDGCLRYVPGTQHRLQDMAALSEAHGWEIPGVVEQGARAGDILVQDMMILHGSQPKRSSGVRRTIYVEYRPSMAIRESGEQSELWAHLRERWMALVVGRAEQGDWPEDWRRELPDDLDTVEKEFAALAARREAPGPSVYAELPVEHPDYPVPADLRLST